MSVTRKNQKLFRVILGLLFCVPAYGSEEGSRIGRVDSRNLDGFNYEVTCEETPDSNPRAASHKNVRGSTVVTLSDNRTIQLIYSETYRTRATDCTKAKSKFFDEYHDGFLRVLDQIANGDVKVVEKRLSEYETKILCYEPYVRYLLFQSSPAISKYWIESKLVACP